MQEMMVAGGNGVVYPWSGPGNKKLLYGTRELGYFGTVTINELFSDSTLSKLVGLTVGGLATAGSAQLWYKFMFHGRIIYLAKYPTRTTLSWLDLYNAGVVYGVKGYGDGPVPASGGIDQFTMLTKYETVNGQRKLWPLKVALPQGANDGELLSSSSWNSDQAEWDVLWAKFFNDKWDPAASWAVMNFSASMWFFTRERTTNGASAAVRGNTSVLAKALAAYATATGSLAWRPKIELITDPNIALSVQYPQLTPGDGLGVPVLSLASDEANPVLGIVDVTLRNSALGMMMLSCQGMDSQIYFTPSTGGESLVSTQANEAPLVQLANVMRSNPSLMPAYQVQTGREEVFAFVPDAQLRITATTDTADATAVSPANVLAIHGSQTGNIAYAYISVEPRVYQTTQVAETFASPTITIEPDA